MNPFASISGRVATIIAAVLIASAVGYHFYAVGVEKAKTHAAEKQRDTLQTWVDTTCASVATPEQKTPELYRTACRIVTARLFSFHSRATSETNQALVKAENERVKKLELDYAAKVRNEQKLKNELRTLKEISANVQNDEVGPDYWAAINRVAGLSIEPEAGTSAGDNPGSSGHVNSTDSTAGTLELR